MIRFPQLMKTDSFLPGKWVSMTLIRNTTIPFLKSALAQQSVESGVLPSTGIYRYKMTEVVHPRPAGWFQENRAEICGFIADVRTAIEDHKRHVLVKAPVKSGKRELVEYMSVALSAYSVKYITSLNRKDVKNQKEELEMYGISTHLTASSDAVSAAIADIHASVSAGRNVIACFDECDYGAGTRQKMSQLYAEFIDNVRVVKVYFSATAHETEASNLTMREDFAALTYVPPPSYCGAEYFLNAGLVFRPAPFFEMDEDTIDVSSHGIQVVQQSITAGRHIGVVRTTRTIPTVLFKDRNVQRALESKLRSAQPGGKAWKIVPVDEKHSHDWENPVIRRGYTTDPDTNYLFVIMQTCTRGTDLKGWHHKLAFWHDQREKEKVNLNTMIQALLRPCHYSTMYDGAPQPIRMYVDIGVVEMAHDDDMSRYLTSGGKAPTRTTRGRAPRSGWGIPFKVSLPEDVMQDPRIETAASDSTRPWLKAVVLENMKPEQAELREMMETRRLMNKRTTGTGIRTVHNAHVAGRRSKPGGGMTEEIMENREDYFWMDVAVVESPGIPRGTVYITYGVDTDDASTASSVTVNTTRASMFESQRGEI